MNLRQCRAKRRDRRSMACCATFLGSLMRGRRRCTLDSENKSGIGAKCWMQIAREREETKALLRLAGEMRGRGDARSAQKGRLRRFAPHKHRWDTSANRVGGRGERIASERAGGGRSIQTGGGGSDAACAARDSDFARAARVRVEARTKGLGLTRRATKILGSWASAG